MPALTALLSVLALGYIENIMATLTIRNIDDKVKRKLQVRAALKGHSMEAEVRELLTTAVNGGPKPDAAIDLGTAIRQRFAALGEIELEIPVRDSGSRPLPAFDR
jgi:plasmid stability protein